MADYTAFGIPNSATSDCVKNRTSYISPNPIDDSAQTIHLDVDAAAEFIRTLALFGVALSEMLDKNPRN